MIWRCHTVRHGPEYDDYRGRGIAVCEEWRGHFEAFATWSFANGWVKGLSIDRKDNNLGYFPDNCRWTDRYTQGNNTRGNHILEAFGERKTLAEWSRDPRCQVSYGTMQARIKK